MTENPLTPLPLLQVNVWSNGFSLWVGRIQLTLRARLDVSRFPFDSHVLTMIVEEFDHPTPELRLIPTPPSFIEDTTGSQFDFDPTYTVERLLYAVPARNTTWDQVGYDTGSAAASSRLPATHTSVAVAHWPAELCLPRQAHCLFQHLQRRAASAVHHLHVLWRLPTASQAQRDPCWCVHYSLPSCHCVLRHAAGGWVWRASSRGRGGGSRCWSPCSCS